MIIQMVDLILKSRLNKDLADFTEWKTITS
jgi:hypothetical protein